MSREISAVALKQLILARQEHAIIDVREQGIYFDSHLLWASNCPLSRLEIDIDALLPRRSVPVIVYDTGPAGREFAARKARHRLEALGYTDVHVLSGGTAAWKDAGFELFSGLNVPSKTFGEYLLQQRKPPEILAGELNARLTREDDLVVLDSRPMDEYHAMSIPSAVDVPGAELVYRVFQIAPDPQTDVVVNCAGRTRSIVGAMSLINAGIPNRVMLLKDGTMGWHLAGLELDHGKSLIGPAPSSDNFKKACRAADRVAEKFGVSYIDHKKLQDWSAAENRTLYMFDVRTREEYESGHVPGSRHAPGGQLVQTTDEYIAAHNARIVLIDDQMVRAVMTASWLLQMGHRDVYVLQEPLLGPELEQGAERRRTLGYEEHETIDPGELKAVMQSGEPMVLVDLACSRNFRAGHIPGAMWCIRQRLEGALTLHQPVGLLVLTSEDGRLAHLAAKDMEKSDDRQIIRVLNGGNQAWQAMGLDLVDGMEPCLSDVDDIWERPYDNQTGQEERMQNYLEWEVQLMVQAERDGTCNFRC